MKSFEEFCKENKAKIQRVELSTIPIYSLRNFGELKNSINEVKFEEPIDGYLNNGIYYDLDEYEFSIEVYQEFIESNLTYEKRVEEEWEDEKVRLERLVEARERKDKELFAMIEQQDIKTMKAIALKYGLTIERKE